MRLFPFVLVLAACATPANRIEPTQPEPIAPAAAPKAQPWKQSRAVVIRHATLLPASGPALADGAIAFAEGKILAVGPNASVATPAGAEEVDGTGYFVSPGIIDAHSHLGVYSSPQSFSNDDGNEATAPVTAEISAEHGFWPQDPGLRRAAAGGVTSLLVLPGSANLIGGRGFPVKLHFGRTPAQMRFPGAKDSLKMACGENPRRVYGQGRNMAPSTRMGNVAGFRQAFSQARDYAERWKSWQANLKRAPDFAGPPPLRDLRLETLSEVLKGNILVQNHCYRAEEMTAMMALAEEFGFSIRAFHHALEAYKIRDALALKKVAVATWADWWGFKMEAWDGIPENAGLITRAGGRAIIHSDSAFGIQRLNQEAAKALWRARQQGLSISDEEALRWVTVNPAWLMGVDDRTGSLEVGKLADVVLWKGHPLSFQARAQRVWSDGLVTFDVTKGPADISDFELGESFQASARLSGSPAPHPALPSAGPEIQPLPLQAQSCVIFSDVTLLSAGEIKNHAHVRVDDGKVSRVEEEAFPVIPPQCRDVDGRGQVLTAGFLDPLTGLGLAEVTAEDSSSDLQPRGEALKQPIHAALRAADGLNPASTVFAVARKGGVTSVGSVPTSGLVSGQSAWVSTGGSLRRAPLAMHIQLGIRGRDALTSTRSAVLERLRELLGDARLYGRRAQDFEQNRVRELSASRSDLEALQPVLAGKLPVVITADRLSDIQAALALAQEFGFKLIIAGGAEAWQLSSELAAAKVAVILQPTSNLPFNFDALGSRQDSAALLSAVGVKVLLSNQTELYRVGTLNQEAANATAWGLPYAEAIRAISSNVAEVFNLPVGRVEPGVEADLVLWSGDPLEAASRPLGMWLTGRQVSLRSRQEALFDKYRSLKP